MVRRILGAYVVAAAVAWAAPGETPRVLVVHSYHETQIGHVVEMTEGIEEALRNSGADIEYVHMDTKRRTSPEWKQRAGQIALEKALAMQPDVVITMDDNAQEYFAKDYAQRPDAAPVVFSGVNADPAKYGFPRPNVTGVIERPNAVESIELLQKIRPEVQRILMLADKSPTTDGFFEYAKTLSLPAEVLAYEQPLTFDEWKATIKKYENQVDALGIYVIRTIRRSADSEECVPEEELIAWINDHVALPTVGFFDTAAKSGILCGVAVSMKEQGYAAGRIAQGILAGRAPESFEVTPTRRGRIMLNLKTAQTQRIRVDYDVIQRAGEVVR